MNETWQRTLSEVMEWVDPSDFREFIATLEPVSESDQCLRLEAPSAQAAEFVRERYLPILSRALIRVSGVAASRIDVIVRQPRQAELFPPAVGTPAAPAVPAPRERGVLEPKYTFSNFVVGGSNQFAHAAARAVASQPGTHYNPLFIYGGVGLGKTHLVHAIGHQLLAQRPDARLVYLSTESFMNELISALRRDRMEEFKSRFRRIDILMLDDVQFLAGRERTQEEFFHTFNSLYENHRQIILTSDKFPKEIPDLEERLRNRFEWGLIADIQPPDMETRVAILEKKAEVEGIELPHDVALFLAAKITSNVRELEGSLTRLSAWSSINRVPISEELAHQVLLDVLGKKEKAITIDSIQKAVCDYFNVRPSELRSRKRTRAVALPRQVAMYLCRRYTRASFPVIGDRFGGRDHSTVIHAEKVIGQRVKDDEQFRETIARIERLLDHPA